MRNIQIRLEPKDGELARFGNQLGALGAGEARKAMARAVNHSGRKVYTQVIRSLVKQTSIPRAMLRREVKTRAAAHKGDGPIEFVIYASGSELPLKEFNPRQFSFGARAKVWGRMQRFPHTFGAAGDNPGVVNRLGGHVFVRTGSARLPIERVYGPSIPKEMLLGDTKETFERTAMSQTLDRLQHELGRMLPS